MKQIDLIEQNKSVVIVDAAWHTCNIFSGYNYNSTFKYALACPALISYIKTSSHNFIKYLTISLPILAGQRRTAEIFPESFSISQSSRANQFQAQRQSFSKELIFADIYS